MALGLLAESVEGEAISVVQSGLEHMAQITSPSPWDDVGWGCLEQTKGQQLLWL